MEKHPMENPKYPSDSRDASSDVILAPSYDASNECHLRVKQNFISGIYNKYIDI